MTTFNDNTISFSRLCTARVVVALDCLLRCARKLQNNPALSANADGPNTYYADKNDYIGTPATLNPYTARFVFNSMSGFQ